MTTEEYRSSPPIPADLATTPAVAAHRQETIDTVRRIMGEDIAPRERPYDQFGSPRTSDPARTEDTSTTQVAKDQAAQVADTAKQAGSQVAGTVTEQAGQVTAEAGKQAKQLLTQAQSEVTEQAAATQQRVSDGLHSLADELAGMASKSEQDGMATDLARQAADKTRQVAGWLADRDPGTLLDEVRSFARRKPGTYLAIALGAGVLSGRLARGLTAPADETTDSAGDVTLGQPESELAVGSRNGVRRNGGPAVPAVDQPLTSMPGLASGASDAYRGDVAP